ncbi:MAG: DUF1700 domain-containing protein [Defluviitaleaceae bacterium]|nr:DUF1700 domain-containing protein [Defluviitaleaceae bacterium]
MTKAAYLEQLDHKLRVLPYSERQDALEYYDGYITDSGSEENAIAQLGTPGEVAAVILANFVANEPPVSAGAKMSAYAPVRKSGFKAAWMIILALFALPVGLPLVIAVGATAFALFVALAAIIFSLGVSGFAAVFAGGLSLLAFPFAFMQDTGFGLITAGMALMGAGIGILLIQIAARFMNGFAWIAKFVGKKIRNITKGRDHHGRPAVQ